MDFPGWTNCPDCSYPTPTGTACENPGCWSNLPPEHRAQAVRLQEESEERKRIEMIRYGSLWSRPWDHDSE